LRFNLPQPGVSIIRAAPQTERCSAEASKTLTNSNYVSAPPVPAASRVASTIASCTFCRSAIGRDLGDEPLVLGQSEQEVDAVGLAPRSLSRHPTESDTRGHRRRMCASTRATFSIALAAASIAALRNLATSRWRPGHRASCSEAGYVTRHCLPFGGRKRLHNIGHVGTVGLLTFGVPAHRLH
jgi:hypothetical protein